MILCLNAAINLCAAMAGKENGDARRAIDLLRVLAEIAERERVSKVEEKHIRLAQEKIEIDTNYEVLKNSTTHTKLVIVAIIKSKNGNTGEVYEIYSSLCTNSEQEPLTQRRITQIISELDSTRSDNKQRGESRAIWQITENQNYNSNFDCQRSIKRDPILLHYIDN